MTTGPGSSGSDPFSGAQGPVPAEGRPQDAPPPQPPDVYGWHGTGHGQGPVAFVQPPAQAAPTESLWQPQAPAQSAHGGWPTEPVYAAPAHVGAPAQSQQAMPAGDTMVDRGSQPIDPRKKGRHAEDRRSGWGGFLKELPFLLIIGFGIVVLVKSFLIQAFYIPSGSMEQTLLVNDRVLVNRQSYAFGHPQRGDVVVFRNWDDVGQDVTAPSTWDYITRSLREGIGLGPSGAKQDLIKRVIGLPGETVEVRASRAIINGVPLEEPYVFVDGPDPLANFGPRVVPEGHYFMLGDHRNNSADSRAGGGRFTDEDAMVGRAFLKIWPPNRIGGLGSPPTPQAAPAHQEPDSPLAAVGMLLVVPARLGAARSGTARSAGAGRRNAGGARGTV